MTHRAIGLVLAVLSVACGGGKSSPTAPTPPPPPPPAPTVAAVTVSVSSDIIFRGADTETAAASVRLSDGSTSNGTGSLWTSDNSAVASVDGAGRITANQSGRANISYTAQGVTGSRTIRVLPNYAGTWSGSYVVRGCDQTGVFITVRFCADTAPINRVLPMNLVLTQGVRDVVSGRFFLGQIQSDSFTAAVETDGAIQFSGVLRNGQYDIDSFWRVNSLQNSRIVGALTQRWTNSVFTGVANVAAEVRDLNR